MAEEEEVFGQVVSGNESDSGNEDNAYVSEAEDNTVLTSSQQIKFSRGPKWNDEESAKLAKYCFKFYDIIEGELKHAVLTSKQKKEKWGVILDKVNR
jgi:hypothetical protein